MNFFRQTGSEAIGASRPFGYDRPRMILHVDIDAFSVEARDRREPAGRPLILG